MKVTSPVGEFPYTFERIRLDGTRIVAEGRMGTWPARIEAGVTDIPAPVRIGVVSAAVGVLVTAGVNWRRNRERRNA
ncbi:hypothetical protein [Mycobacterium sp. NAZ190054]|uniref:hypothetical protein n=1 Tax=Mycobacterium sp. NAZ190054 TaxID=1747766 RepID=UPI000793BF22|nr:hypothetical protein [Mycobacterium sp. NAZ190054]KWX66431.1 hypothetical protein ASJ79_06240 [Mycobacterium sp. NAZ190054]